MNSRHVGREHARALLMDGHFAAAAADAPHNGVLIG